MLNATNASVALVAALRGGIAVRTCRCGAASHCRCGCSSRHCGSGGREWVPRESSARVERRESGRWRQVHLRVWSGRHNERVSGPGSSHIGGR